MFAAKTRSLVQSVGAEGDLVYNENINEKMEMFTLVKVRRKLLWPVVKYTIMDQSLLDLLEEPEYSPEYTEEVLTEDFQSQRGCSGGGSAEAGVTEAGLDLGTVKVSAGVDVVDGASATTLMKKTMNIQHLRRSLTDRKLKMKFVEMLRLKKKEKLNFVYQTVFNTAPVTFFDVAGQHGSVSAACKLFLKLSVMSKRKEQTSFTVPEESTFAYGLMPVTTEGGTLGIPPRSRKVRQYNKEMKMKEALLRPLADLPELTRRDLLKTICELLDDGDALQLLVEQLNGEDSECPPPQTVSSFMDLLRASDAAPPQRNAVLLLLEAIDALPDAAPLIGCCPDTQRVLDQLVSGLLEDGQAALPEAPPPPLQEGGELHWAAELLCSTNETLSELKEHWDRPELPVQVLLEVLCLLVRGLGLMKLAT